MGCPAAPRSASSRGCGVIMCGKCGGLVVSFNSIGKKQCADCGGEYNLVEHKPVVIKKAWEFGEKQTFTVQGRVYDVNAALLLAEKLPVETVPVRYLALDYRSPCDNTVRSFAEHMKQVNAADLDVPVLMTESGVVIDGRHRIIKALVEGVGAVKCRRFDVDPPACYTLEDD